MVPGAFFFSVSHSVMTQKSIRETQITPPKSLWRLDLKAQIESQRTKKQKIPSFPA
jgi:hypothetical protein